MNEWLVVANGGALLVIAGGTALWTRATAKATEKQIERAHRPILVPYQRNEQVLFRGGSIHAVAPQFVENPPDRDDLPSFSAVFLPVENVGMGPALNVRGEVAAPRGVGEVRFPNEGIAAGATGVVAYETWKGDSLQVTGNDHGIVATLDYDDVTGSTYRTEISFDIGNNAYRAQTSGPL